MSTSLILHLSSGIGIVACLLLELLLAKTLMSATRSYALMLADVFYNLAIYLCIGTGILLMALSPEGWLEQLQNPWLLGKIGILLLVACFAALPSWLIFSLRSALTQHQPGSFSAQRLLGLRLLIGSELLLFAAIVWLAQQVALSA